MNGTEKGVLVSYFTLFYIQVDTVQGWEDGWGTEKGSTDKEIGTRGLGREGERERTCSYVKCWYNVLLHEEVRGQPWVSFLRHNPKVYLWWQVGGDR